jgi:ankyrin repeat protein
VWWWYRNADLISVFHLAASSLTQQSYTFFSILLKNPHTQINAQDTESGYTALHRCLFAGNIKAARELLARSDCDTSIRDAEGMTAFELYNGTVDGVSVTR